MVQTARWINLNIIFLDYFKLCPYYNINNVKHVVNLGISVFLREFCCERPCSVSLSYLVALVDAEIDPFTPIQQILHPRIPRGDSGRYIDPWGN